MILILFGVTSSGKTYTMEQLVRLFGLDVVRFDDVQKKDLQRIKTKALNVAQDGKLAVMAIFGNTSLKDLNFIHDEVSQWRKESTIHIASVTLDPIR